MRSGYYHLELSSESQPKSAFVIGGPKGGKWEFKRCPFRLTQAPAYFQMLVNKVLEGLTFAFVILMIYLYIAETWKSTSNISEYFSNKCAKQT